jgi:hypothetical protein
MTSTPDLTRPGDPRVKFAQPRQGYLFIEARPCRGCGVLIGWWTTPVGKGGAGGKRSPHDPDGTSHFATCPEAARFRRRPAAAD